MDRSLDCNLHLSLQLNDIKLSHAEDLHRREEEIEAQFAGEIAYLKLHHKEKMEEMQAQHNSEV